MTDTEVKKIPAEDTIPWISKCPFCGKLQTITIKKSEYNAWRNGTVAQEAFKDLTPSERELIITGICDDCWPSEPEDI